MKPVYDLSSGERFLKKNEYPVITTVISIDIEPKAITKLVAPSDSA